MTVKRKLGSQQGFSLAELLLAVLILLLVSTIVATGVPAARNAYYKVILASNAQSVLTTAATALRDEFSTAWDISVEENTVTYFNPDTGVTSQLGLTEESIEIYEYVASQGRMLGNTPTGDVSYQRNLLPEAAIPDGMSLVCDSVSYDDTTGILTFSSLQVIKEDTVLVELESLPIRVLSASSETISKPMPADDTAPEPSLGGD